VAGRGGGGFYPTNVLGGCVCFVGGEREGGGGVVATVVIGKETVGVVPNLLRHLPV